MTASTQLLGLLTVSQPFIWRIEILRKPLQSTHCSHLHPLAVEPEWSRDRPSGLPRAADQPELVNRGIGFAPDSLLEQAGFELMVPRVAGERCRKDKLPSRAMALVGARRGSMSAPFMAGP